MTFNELKSLIKKYKIHEDVVLESDSGWECGATDMNGVYYHKRYNVIVFTQNFNEYDNYYNNAEWIKLTQQENKGE